MDGDLISVIVPVYNVEHYLEKCVTSILNQTYTNLEIILVDDGSTDYSGIMCDELEKMDARIKVIHKANGGLSSARNAGIDSATGKYIGFIDSDDYIDVKMFELLYSAIKNNSADISVCNYSWVNENGRVFNTTTLNNAIYSSDEVLCSYFLDNLSSWVIACNKLYLTSLFKEIRYPEGKINEDSFVIHHILNNCKKITSIPESLYFYFQRSGSITKSKFKVSRFDVVDSHFDRTWFYISSNFKNKEKLATKSLMKALSSYHSCCFEIKKSEIDDCFKEKNSQIQKEYRNLYKKCSIDKLMGIRNIILMSMCYISVFNTYKFIDFISLIISLREHNNSR